MERVFGLQLQHKIFGCSPHVAGMLVFCKQDTAGWYCLSSPKSCLQFLNFSSTPLMITGILFFTVDDGLTG